jgi:hypothetical protein
VDRGQLSVRGTIALPKAPVISFSYTHSTRDGRKDSTILGDTMNNLNSPLSGRVTEASSSLPHPDAFNFIYKSFHQSTRAHNTILQLHGENRRCLRIQ